MTIDAANLQMLRRNTFRGRGRSVPFVGRVMRVVSVLILLLLVTTVFLYVRMTNSDRVRSMASDFLSRGIEGKVTIGDARLSIFEGLLLRDVVVATNEDAANPTVFFAPLLEIHYSPKTLWTGEIESARVIATEPEVFLVENVDRGTWNFESLRRSAAATTPASQPEAGGEFRAPKLPEVLIRSGRVHRAQIVNGVQQSLATMRLEGQLLPRAGEYQFNLQTRTDAGLAGPALQGEFSLISGLANSSLTNVNLDFLETLLPAKVREFWMKLSPTGRVDVPVLGLTRHADGRSGFQIELELNDVNMTVRPLDWTSARERAILTNAKEISAALQAVPRSLLLAAAIGVQPAIRAGEIPLNNVQGRFVFTDAGVDLKSLEASIDENRFAIQGSLGSYAFDAPINVTLESPAQRPIEIQKDVPYINSLPAEIREVYYRFRPQGRSKLRVELARASGNAALRVEGALEFANAQFVFEEFPYPVFNASGRLVIDNDPSSNEPRLVIDHVRGVGASGGPNAQGELGVSGVITPLIGYASVDVTVSGTNIVSEPALIEAIPKDARAIVHEFDDDGDGPNPRFTGDFVCRVHREPGPISKWTYDTDLAIRNGYGSFKGFPFPLEEFSAQLQVRKDYVRIVSADSSHAGAKLSVTGLTEWGARVNPNRRVGEPSTRSKLSLAARKVPMDAALLNAIPREAREQLERLGIDGVFDITGDIHVNDPRKPPEFDLSIAATNARFAPTNWKTQIDEIEGSMQLTPRSIRIDHARGRRGDAPVSVSGLIDFAAEPTLDLSVRAEQFQLDASAHDSLPEPGQAVWDSLRPEGATDLVLNLLGPVASPKWTLDLRPSGMKMNPDFFPMPMSNIIGRISAQADRIELDGVQGSVAGGNVSVSGVGEFASRSAWTLRIQSTETLVDDAFRNALPEALKTLLTDNQIAGRANFSFDQLAWTRSPDNAATDIVFDSKFDLLDAGWTVGVPFGDVIGSIALKGKLVDDDLAALNGTIDLKTFTIAGIPARDGQALIETDEARRVLQLKDVRAQIGEGDIAGRVHFDRSRRDSTKWSADLLMRNADVSTLTSGNGALMSGRMNASLAIEGAWSADGKRVGPRRGRGDISVSGENMVNVPMIVGVTQIVSLSLPFTGGFNEADASYSIDGDRVSFNDISLKSNEMRIKGNGSLHFDTRTLSLDFYTANAGKRLPVIGGLLDAARKELFQIKVRGTLNEPQVTAGSLQTITTTVDEILGSDEK